FSYAGCKSAITSLWKASDLSTAYIGRRLHYYLSHGYSKDEALRKSKLDFLNDNGIDPSYKSTSSWAHLIFIGDSSPISENSHEIIWVIIISFIFLSIFAMLLYKKNRTQN
ncbi:MAG TPA: CHAT domain-containing protein, partial [Puia sp.]|nr:CHAT domain-containing protein [Puia sp.]